LRYRDYLDVTRDPDHPDFSRRLSIFATGVVCEDVFLKPCQDLSAAQRSGFDRLLNTDVFATRDAPPAQEEFPVVLYHPGAGGSFEDNSVLFEFLASHGYIVLSSAYESPDASYISNSHGTFADSLRDIAFLLNYAHALPFAANAPVVGMGHSIGAQEMLEWIGEEDSPASAMIGLDSTVEYAGLNSPLYRNIKEDLSHLRQPRAAVLLFAQQTAPVKLDTFRQYLFFTPYYEATVSYLKHDDFLTHGAVRGQFDSGADQAEAARVRASYGMVCDRVLTFLDAYVKQDAEALSALKSLTGSRQGVNQTFFAPENPPPTARQIVIMIGQSGVENVLGILQQLRYVSEPAVLDAGRILLENKQYSEADAVQRFDDLRFPDSFPGKLFLAELQAAKGDKGRSMITYRKLMNELPHSRVPEPFRQFLMNQAERGMAELKEKP
jgi:hypothetical protein